MNKPIAFTLVVLLVLIGLYALIGGGFYGSPEKQEITLGFKSFTSIDFDAVTRVSISKGKDAQGEAARVVLEKGEDGWVVASSWNYEADDEKVDKIIESARKIKDGEMVGTFPASHPDFEVDEVHGGFLAFFDKQQRKLGELVVGKSAPFTGDIGAERKVFVRASGEDTTYRVASSIQNEANLHSRIVEGKRFLKTTIFELPDSDEIYQVRLVRDGVDDLIVERRYRIKEEEKKDETGDDASSGEGEPETGEETTKKEPEKKEPETEEYFVVTSGTEVHEVGKDETWKARGLVDRGKTIRIEDAAAPEELSEYGLDAPQVRAVISFRKKKDEDARSKELEFLIGNVYKDDKGEDDGYYVLLRGAGLDGRPYKLAKWNYDSWNKELKEFLPKEEEKKEEGSEDTSQSKAGSEASGQPEPATARPAEAAPVPVSTPEAESAGPKPPGKAGKSGPESPKKP